MTTTAGALGPVVDVLVAESVEGLSVAELQARLTVVGPQLDRLDGWWSRACGELQCRTGGVLRTEDGGTRTVASWLAEQQRESPSTVGSQLKTSTALRSLPLVAAAVLDGELTQGQAAVLARLVGRIPEQALAEAEPALVRLAGRLNPAELAAQVRHLLATHCEPLLDDQAERARQRRYLQTRQDGDGMLRGRFAVPLGEGAEALLTAIEALSRRDELGDDRTAGQRRADALVELAEQALRHGGTATCPSTADSARRSATCYPPTGPPARPSSRPAGPAPPARSTGRPRWLTPSTPACPAPPASRPGTLVRPPPGPARPPAR